MNREALTITKVPSYRRIYAIVATLMLTIIRTRFDQFGKQMVRAALAKRGPIETDAEVVADVRRIDLWFMPDPSPVPVPDHLGLLGRITAGPSTLEFFHNTPSGEELAACMVKHGDFRHILSLRKPPPPIPTQWVISSGRPDSGIDGLAFIPMKGWPTGIYEGPSLLWTRLVVVSELPVTRETLLLRLLGADRVLHQAIAELKALEADAPERTIAMPVLLRLRLEIPVDPANRTNDDQEFLMDTQDIVETWRREAIREGRVDGKREALLRLLARAGIVLTQEERDRVAMCTDIATLDRWFDNALAARTSDDVFSTV